MRTGAMSTLPVPRYTFTRPSAAGVSPPPIGAVCPGFSWELKSAGGGVRTMGWIVLCLHAYVEGAVPMSGLARSLAGAAVALAILTSCGGNAATGEAATAPAATAAATTQAAKAGGAVPDVVGSGLGEAQTKLWAAGLECEARSEEGKTVSDTSGWTVVSQTPAAGEEAEEGSSVRLVVKGDAVTVPDVVGMRYDQARDRLQAVGLEPDVRSDSGKSVLSAKNWTVLSQEPKAGSSAKTGDVVDVLVSKDAGAQEQGGSTGAAASGGSEQSALSAKLKDTTAILAMETYGTAAFPYGFKMHKFLGEIAREPKDEDTWFLKYEVTVTNEYGAKRDTVAEAYVTGTDDNPQVTYFLVY